MNNQVIDRTTEDRIIELYRYNSCRKVGELIGCSHQAVIDVLRRRGVPIRPRGVNIACALRAKAHG